MSSNVPPSSKSSHAPPSSVSSNVPPSYADLGKVTRDLFSKGFNYGFYKLETKTKTQSGIEFNTTSSSNHDSGKFHGNLEMKYKWTDYGLCLTEKWTTDNTLANEVTIEDKLLQGLKLSFDASFSPPTGKKTGKIRSEYKREYVHTNCEMDFDFAGPTIYGAAVLGYKGFLGGYQMVFDTAKSTLSQNNFALGYTNPQFTLHSTLKDGSEITTTVYQKVNDQLDVGFSLDYTFGSNCTKFGVAGKYAVDKDTTFRGKLNSNGQIGASYQQRIRAGLTLTLSSLIEGKTLNQGGHKVGLGVELEA
jgi:voltage-dependent anion channel protein 2